MQGQNDSIDFLIKAVWRCMDEAGITEPEDGLLREVAQNLASLINGIRQERFSKTADSLQAGAASTRGDEVVYTREEINRLNRAAEAYFQKIAVHAPFHLLNKPLSGFFDPPNLLYRLGILLAGLNLGAHTVLDFGAGSCWVSSMLNRMGCRTIAVDVSETALRYGIQLFELDKRHRMDLNPQFLVYDGYTIPLHDETVERIVCFDAFHHVPNKQDILNEMHRVLKGGGRAGFSEPGAHHAKSALAMHEMETYGVLESDIDLNKFIRMAQYAGFNHIFIKPYPPPDHISFTVEEYEKFVRGQNRIFPVGIIRHSLKDYSDIILQKGIATPDSKRPNILNAALKTASARPVKVNAGKEYAIQLEITNIGDTIWLAAPNPMGGFVTIGAHLYRENGVVMDWDYGGVQLPNDIPPGEEQIIEISLTAPKDKGVYYIEFDMVCQMICWFAERGSKTLRVKIEVF